MTNVDIEQAIANARELGYLVTKPNVTRPQHRWLKIAQQEGFPYVAMLITAYRDGRGGVRGGIRVMWDASHLPDQVATAAHVLMKLEHLTHAGTETVLQPKSGAIGTLSLEDAKALAAKIAALTTTNPIPQVETYIEDVDGVWSLSIKCPYCGRVHHHGGGRTSEAPALGHRVSHCTDQATPGYELIAGPVGMKKPKA